MPPPLMNLVLLYSSLCSLSLPFAAASGTTQFIYNGFSTSTDITFDGLAHLSHHSLLQLTNDTTFSTGHAFYTHPISFNNISSFSTTFVFAMVPLYATKGGHGMAFVISPTKNLSPVGAAGQFMGLMNESSKGNSSNRIFAVEFDAIETRKFHDLADDHVGIDINDMESKVQKRVAYVDEKGAIQNLTLLSEHPLQAWIDYDGFSNQINVTLAPFRVPKPSTPLMSFSFDISLVLAKESYVGFSAATGPELTSDFYVAGWSFKMNGRATDLDLSKLPKIPHLGRKQTPLFYKTGLPLICLVAVAILGFVAVYVVGRRKKFAEVLEDWEQEFGPHRFKFKDLYMATKGFRESELLGKGGFGSVYKGVLPAIGIEVAVKKVSHDSKQGIREFVAEVVSIGRLRHRNLVRFLGYCRRKGELFLVYEYMPNRSLDRYLYNPPNDNILSWSRRFAVVKGVASGLLYLHEGWEQVVIHRDIKASNILLDSEFNGKIGDFGLARLYDHGTDPHTTHIVGTLGYLAPEQTRTGKATTSSDVYAFGAFLLEVATGKRPIQPKKEAEDFVLVDWVFSCWAKGNVFEAMDRNLGMEYAKGEAELVLKLGLLCSHPDSGRRPTIRQAVQYLEGDGELPELSAMGISSSHDLMYSRAEGFDSFVLSHKSSMMNSGFSGSTSITESFLSGGR
ncbi:L-type lectin-domain containing receptor kinase IV.1-like [Ipomoea triloba]|uniref:L-type lectin-domain containing receptor kinase IV.1-like n=1 Tax=Ipomoea triloba TaxID=35885 RepID=UPI00125DFA07|nr:L-type lectin-domain containing receptor kinase IV.1-like [Ipomoea triloba]